MSQPVGFAKHSWTFRRQKHEHNLSTESGALFLLAFNISPARLCWCMLTNCQATSSGQEGCRTSFRNGYLVGYLMVFSTYTLDQHCRCRPIRKFDGPSFKLARVLQQSSYRGPLPSSFGLFISVAESDWLDEWLWLSDWLIEWLNDSDCMISSSSSFSSSSSWSWSKQRSRGTYHSPGRPQILSLYTCTVVYTSLSLSLSVVFLEAPLEYWCEVPVDEV